MTISRPCNTSHQLSSSSDPANPCMISSVLPFIPFAMLTLHYVLGVPHHRFPPTFPLNITQIYCHPYIMTAQSIHSLCYDLMDHPLVTIEMTGLFRESAILFCCACHTCISVEDILLNFTKFYKLFKYFTDAYKNTNNTL